MFQSAFPTHDWLDISPFPSSHNVNQGMIRVTLKSVNILIGISFHKHVVIEPTLTMIHHHLRRKYCFFLGTRMSSPFLSPLMVVLFIGSTMKYFITRKHAFIAANTSDWIPLNQLGYELVEDEPLLSHEIPNP